MGLEQVLPLIPQWAGVACVVGETAYQVCVRAHRMPHGGRFQHVCDQTGVVLPPWGVSGLLLCCSSDVRGCRRTEVSTLFRLEVVVSFAGINNSQEFVDDLV